MRKVVRRPEAPPDSGGTEIAALASTVRQHVAQIIESPAFKGSRRSRQFLEHIVEKKICDRIDELKERGIGAELFGRVPSYDTGQDAIVRVTASDVRRRLHQFYDEADPDYEVRIELHSGTYVPEFITRVPVLPPPLERPVWNVEAVPTTLLSLQTKTRPQLRRTIICSSLVLSVVLISGLVFWYARTSKSQPLAQNVLPWSAVLRSGRQTQLVLSDPDIYRTQKFLGSRIPLSGYMQRDYVPYPESLAPEVRRALELWKGVDVASVDLGIAIKVFALVPKNPGQIKLRMARDIQMRDFKVEDDFTLLGSPQSNPWAALFQDQLDFDFVYDQSLKQEVIRNKHPKTGELATYISNSAAREYGEAFAIIALVGNPNHTGHVLMLAGTGPEGTETACNLTMSTDVLAHRLQKYGIDLRGPDRYFQVLLRLRTTAGAANSVDIIAAHTLANGPGI
jgi:hypothetical protein